MLLIGHWRIGNDILPARPNQVAIINQFVPVVGTARDSRDGIRSPNQINSKVSNPPWLTFPSFSMSVVNWSGRAPLNTVHLIAPRNLSRFHAFYRILQKQSSNEARGIYQLTKDHKGSMAIL